MENKYFKFKELLSLPIKRAAYSDRTAWLMANMSKLAYLPFEDDDTELKTALSEAEFSLIETFNQDGTQAFLAKRDSDKMAILSFRGTQTEGLNLETFFDVFTDLYASMHTDEKGVKTHKGFQVAFQKVEPAILQQIQKLSDYGLYITGHSLGGALALIATSAINAENLGACYTFGSPKVGNEEFDDKIKAPIYRVINSYDVVPFLPFTRIMLPLFWLISKKIKNDKVKILIENFKEYQHHGDMRFLTNVAVSADAKALTEFPELNRSLNLIRLSFTVAKDIGVQHHSLDLYCEKLAGWALKRIKI
ncbi:MAG: lipase family protein [Nanoarchaeota archaeon]|nr:lipase family protein [Nanoarchaeota archaeon]